MCAGRAHMNIQSSSAQFVPALHSLPLNSPSYVYLNREHSFVVCLTGQPGSFDGQLLPLLLYLPDFGKSLKLSISQLIHL